MRRILLAACDAALLVVGLALAWAAHAQLAPPGEIEEQTPRLLAPLLFPLVPYFSELGMFFGALVAGRFVLKRALGPGGGEGKESRSEISFSNISAQGSDRIERVGKKLSTRAASRKVQMSDLVDDIILAAEFLGASDLHIEPKETSTRLWFRIDGVMQDIANLPKEREREMINRLRVLSHLELTKMDTPQDGRIDGQIRGHDLNLRLSIFPTLHGFKAVVRLLETSANSLRPLNALGIEPAVLKRFQRLIHSPQGMILFTGPTGSGKTTLVYSALKEMLSEERTRRNIVTLEDPIERAVPSINQTQIDRARGLSFAIALRTILRQDPNVIMVGEIRDGETAEIALRAGQTGHLILTTLHTNSASSSFSRLVDMGIAPFLLASTITGVVGARLVRKLCPDCRAKNQPGEVLLSQVPGALPPGFQSWESGGCALCQNSGFIGRTLIFELLEMNDAVAKAVIDKASAAEIQRIAEADGMLTLLHDGLGKASAGTTSLLELLRVAT